MHQTDAESLEEARTDTETRARDVLRNVFGFPDFRDRQAAIIQSVVEGDNALVLMPTGGGKSLCYQIPALIRDGTAVVISPLIALMRDQVEALRHNGVRAAYLNSTLDPEERQATLGALHRGELDLLYVAPETLLGGSLLDRLTQIPVALFAIDEAHCVSQWGHDFRPEYMRLAVLAERFPAVPRIALTATADDRTRAEIARQLFPDGAREWVSSFDRPNIRYQVGLKDNARRQLLAFIQRHHEGDAGIVYCLSRKKTEAVAEWLRDQGINARPYHAGLGTAERQATQERFLREDDLVVVATVAFGMGIDKPDVRFVAHLDLPKSIESYYQETGRAGRDGLLADAWMLYGLQDVYQLRQLLSQSTAGVEQQLAERRRLESMLAFCESSACRRRSLLEYFGESREADCGNCDNCLEPPATWDATEAARKFLSCVYRTGQRFGAAHVVDVLLGSSSERIRRQGHDRLSTFGIGKELDKRSWNSVARQLLARGYLTTDPEGHGGLRLSDSCRSLLKGEETLHVRRDAVPASRTKRKRASPDDVQAGEWEALRRCRREQAEAEGVPPFVIFHDATLMEMLRLRPRSLDQMADVPGVGRAKLERYGQLFLDVLAGLDAAPGDTPSHHQTGAMLASGTTADAVAAERNIAVSTVFDHAARCVEEGRLELDAVLDLPAGAREEIEQVLLEEGGPDASLRAAHDRLEGAWDFKALKLVRAGLRRETGEVPRHGG